MSIGSQILMERRKRKVRQDALAAKMGIHLNTLVDIERDRLNIGTEILTEALKALNEINPEVTTAA